MASDNDNKPNDNNRNNVGDSPNMFVSRTLAELVSRNAGIINIIEMLLWLFFLYMHFFVEDERYIYGDSGYVSFFKVYHEMGVGFKTLFFFLFPLAFTMVYRISPIQMIVRRAFSINDSRTIIKANRLSSRESKQKTKAELAESYLEDLVASSSELAKNVYSRGSLYLLFGVIFSIIGLSFFYSQVHVSDLSAPKNDIANSAGFINELIYLLPKFGILFFIELISFFFLKQYRVTMDEFRYYEAIKRSREETLAVVKLISINSIDVDYMSVMDKLKFSSNVGKLEDGQTTEILEARKFDKDELDFLAKIVEAMAKKKE